MVQKITEQNIQIKKLQQQVDELSAAEEGYIDNINSLIQENQELKKQSNTQR